MYVDRVHKAGSISVLRIRIEKNADADPGKNLDADPDADPDADSCPY